MSQIIKVRPKVELKAMQMHVNTLFYSSEIFSGVISYSIDENRVHTVCLGDNDNTVLKIRDLDWIVNQYDSIFVVSDYNFQKYYNQPEELNPTTINNFTFNITNNSKDEFANDIMGVIEKYGVTK